MENEFANINAIKTKIINLSANLNLPKGTEAFISDIHGNNDKYLNIIRSGAGNISRKVEELFNGRLTTLNQKKLVCLIYYPEEVLEKNDKQLTDIDESEQWYMDTINHLIEVMRYVANKYPSNIVKIALDNHFHEFVYELSSADLSAEDKQPYYHEMIKNIVNLRMGADFTIAVCHAIQKLAIERIHIIGDTYDRGAHPDLIIEHLNESWQNFDFEWGNHDVLWMGSMAGSKLCMLNLLRISARYHNLGLLEDVYDMDLTSLRKFASNRYKPLPNFEARVNIAGLTDAQRDLDTASNKPRLLCNLNLKDKLLNGGQNLIWMIVCYWIN